MDVPAKHYKSQFLTQTRTHIVPINGDAIKCPEPENTFQNVGRLNL